MNKRGGFVIELGIALVISTVVGVAFLLATGELGAAWDSLRDEEQAEADASEGVERSPSPTDSTSPEGEGEAPPPDQVAYIDVNHISDELQEGGVICDETNVHVRDDESQTGTCISAAGTEVTIFVFLDPGAAPASFDRFDEATEGQILEGPNWFLATTDTEFLAQAQEVLGGDLREL